jgi:hypothetical protein
VQLQVIRRSLGFTANPVVITPHDDNWTSDEILHLHIKKKIFLLVWMLTRKWAVWGGC